MSTKNEPSIKAFIGASGSGKGVSLVRELRQARPARLLIWDPRDEYKGHAEQVRSLRELVQRVAAAGAGPFRLRYSFNPAAFGQASQRKPLEAAFAIVCRLAFEAGNLTFLAEELSDVTSASQAPPAWRQVITQGRHRGLVVLAAAQRPALIDKTLLGNCTYIRCLNLRYSEDRRAMAKAMDVAEDAITKLGTTKTQRGVVIRYLERDFRAGGPAAEGSIVLKT